MARAGRTISQPVCVARSVIHRTRRRRSGDAAQQPREPAGPAGHAPCLRKPRARPARGLRGALCGHERMKRGTRASGRTRLTRPCCTQLYRVVSRKCRRHRARFDCPDALVGYWPHYDEYGLIVHDGGSSMVLIFFCPWCGSKLPSSKRDRWFRELEAQGIEPGADPTPRQYRTDSWWRTGNPSHSRGPARRSNPGGLPHRVVIHNATLRSRRPRRKGRS